MAVANREKELQYLIQIKKHELINLGLTKGLKHQDTIDCSQQLDNLIFKIQKASVPGNTPN